MTMERWAGRTVLVTGGLGFIGSHFVEELLALDAQVICMHRGDRSNRLAGLPRNTRLRVVETDLLDLNEVDAVCRYVAPRIDTIIHCAALDGNTHFKLRHAARILDANLRTTSNVLNCAREHGIEEVVLLSSAEVYSMSSADPIREEDDYRKHMRYSPNGYFLSKNFGEVLAELHRVQFGMKIFLPRPTNVYGPRDNFHPASNRVIPSMLARLAADEEIEIWGTGSQTRSFIHVTDLVRATLQMVEHDGPQVLNMGTSESVSILELARILTEVLGKNDRIRFLLDKPTGSSSLTLDVSMMESVIDFEPRSLRDGLAQTVDWYLNRRLPEPVPVARPAAVH